MPSTIRPTRWNKVAFTLLAVVVIVVAFGLWQKDRLMDGVLHEPATDQAIQLPPMPEKPVAEANYSCDRGKQIMAVYYNGPTIPVQPGEPPIPTGRVELSLGDGRNMTLPQTLSASGIRYASSDESVIFWSKGEGAFIVERGVETYSNCMERIWTLGNAQLDDAVTNFLLSYQQLSWKTEAGSTNFCVFQNLMPERMLFPHYLWVRCGEYKLVDGQLKELSGTSVPLKLDYPNELSFYDLTKFTVSIPRDGTPYERDVKKIFPKEIWSRLNFESGPLNERITRLARDYFSLHY